MPELRRWALAAALVAGACAAPAPERGFRSGPGQIGSAVLFDAARFAGDWQLAAAAGEEAACGPLRQRWSPAPGGFAVAGQACRGGAAVPVATVARVTGPGRMEVEGEGSLWVLWADDDYRVVAVGRPDGAFGRVLVRPDAARADLIRAATEVLVFNGYAAAAIRPVAAAPLPPTF